MAYFRKSIVLWVSLALPALAAAQADPPPTYRGAGAASGTATAAQQQGALKPMYEDIETLRRLLNRAVTTQQMSQCTSCHGSGVVSTGTFTADRNLGIATGAGDLLQGFSVQSDDRAIKYWDLATGRQVVHPPAAHPFTGVEGVYLRGVGVVYTMTLPFPPEAVKEAPRKPAPPRMSDWERTYRQVLGESVEPGAVRERPVQPSLRDIILKTLAENGRHFKHLSPNESLTVVVTFRGSVHGQPVTGGMMGGFGGGSGMGPGGGGFGGFGGGGFGGGGLGGAGGGPGGGGGKGASGFGGRPPRGKLGASDSTSQEPAKTAEALAEALSRPNTARDYELLGDLVLKQGKADEAIAAFKKGTELSSDPRQLATLHRKLAQAYLNRAQDASALQALQKAMEFAGKLPALPKGKGASKSARPAVALPAQLVISIPRGLADQYASGALSYDRFREAAHVELRKFTDLAQ
jgi:hypothetical protein